ncbi:MAG: putative glycosyltransferase [Actinomycetia bacterium]|nr:putative glycosyltransferase [Actinomycetes bacterium]
MDFPPPDVGEPILESVPDLPDPAAVAPPVVAVVVTSNGTRLGATLEALAAQDYPSLTVLVLDAGSQTDPTPVVAASLAGAYVRRLDGNVGFARAANEALAVVEGATFLLFCHDDVELEPTAARLLVEEAYRSNAAIAGPKLVDARNPHVLLEVGMAIDRFGVPFSGIEPGEIDQEQHDGARDVFYVSTAAMLVRTDLFRELDGFDPTLFPGAEDIDLCWRARIAGARVMVVPDARARHFLSAPERIAAEPIAAARTTEAEVDAVVQRNRVRAMLTAYRLRRLLWVVPTALLLVVAECVALVGSGQFRRAGSLVRAWAWNLGHLGTLRRARKRVRNLRAVPDSDLVYLQIGGSTRLRVFFAHHFRAEERLQSIGDARRRVVGAATDRVHRPALVASVAFVVLAIIGSRGLFLQGIPAFGGFSTWTSVGSLFHAYGSGWRFAGLGSASPAPPALAFFGGLGTLFLGFVGTARTMLVIATMPLGAFGVYRLSRPFSRAPGPALLAGLAYGSNPVARNAISAGDVGAMVFFTLLPFIVSRLLLLVEARGNRSPVPAFTFRWWSRLVPLGVLIAVVTACLPSAPLLLLLIPIAFLIFGLISGGLRLGGRASLALLAGGLIALVLLLPWPLELLGGVDRGSVGFTNTTHLHLSEILRFHVGAAGAGWVGWALLGAAALPLVVGTGERLTWAGRVWVLALLSFAAAWLPGRLAASQPIPSVPAILTLAALGLAVAVGLGASAFVDDLRQFGFGWRQVASVAAAVLLLFPVFGFALDAIGGRWRAPEVGWASSVSADSGQGSYRVLWIGSPSVLPADATLAPHGLGFAFTTDGIGDVSERWIPPAGHAEQVVRQALQAIESGATDRAGRLLAPFGVRFVALTSRLAPGAHATPPVPVPAAVVRGFEGQLDLRTLQAAAGIQLYENLSWAPVRSIVPVTAAVPGRTSKPLEAALSTDLSPARPVRGPLGGSAPAPAGTLLWLQRANPSWHATSNGKRLVRRDAFGLTNSYEHPDAGPISLSFTDQLPRSLALAGQGVIWIAALLVSRRDARRRRGAHERGSSRVQLA